MANSPRRRYLRALNEGTQLLDRGYEQLHSGDELAAEESVRKAIIQLHLADVLAGFSLEDVVNGSEIVDEIARSERLLQNVSIPPPDPNSPASTILVFDERIATGDSALRADNLTDARDAYVDAYAALYSLLPPSYARDLPSPSNSREPATSDADKSADDCCDLCWVEGGDTTFRFRGDSVRACGRCSNLVGKRFPTADRLFVQCDRIITDLREITETDHGLAWLSSTESPGDDPVSESLPTSSGPASPEQVHLLRDLVAVSQLVGRPATPADFRKHGEHTPSDVRDAFGSWDHALRETGLAVDLEE